MVRAAWLLVAHRLFLNLYPSFDFATVRIPGVLQRIGLCYALAASSCCTCARGFYAAPGSLPVQAHADRLRLFILVSYWALLYFVPVPGFGAPRFDPVGSWPSVIDRAVIGVAALLSVVAGRRTGGLRSGRHPFDLAGLFQPAVRRARRQSSYASGALRRPAAMAIVCGLAMMLLALLTQRVDPIIKNLWTSSFALFSSGFALLWSRSLLMPISQRSGVSAWFAPARVFGENPLLAYMLCFLIAPLIDAHWFGTAAAPRSLRDAGQAWFDAIRRAARSVAAVRPVRRAVHLRRVAVLSSAPLDPQALMELIDIGANLAHDSFDADRDAVLQRAATCRRRANGGHRFERRGTAHGRSNWRARIPACCSPPPVSIRIMRRI